MMHQHPVAFNQSYQHTQPPALVGHSWAMPSPAVAMETVAGKPCGAMSHQPLPPSTSRQQQPPRGPGYSPRGEHRFESNTLPLLSMRDLQCLDAGPQASGVSQSDSQPLFHLQHQREELATDTRAQNHLSNQNQGQQTVWPSFNTLIQVQNTNSAVPEGGGGAQGLTPFPFLEDGDYLKGLVGGGSQTSLWLKQEPQITVGQEPPRDNRGNTYTNLLPPSVSNGANMDPRRPEGGGSAPPLKHLHSPYSSSSTASEGHYPTLADWIKATRHSE